MPANIDQLAPSRSLIDLTKHSDGNFGIEGLELTQIFDDILLVEYIDETDDGEVIRNGIVVPTNALNKAWRKAKVILVGPNAKFTKRDDIVIFPNNLGVSVSNIDVEGKGKIKSGIFLNEDRVFGICKQKNES
jgi:cellobiose-specific phosphotransferase system component IIB